MAFNVLNLISTKTKNFRKNMRRLHRQKLGIICIPFWFQLFLHYTLRACNQCTSCFHKHKHRIKRDIYPTKLADKEKSCFLHHQLGILWSRLKQYGQTSFNLFWLLVGRQSIKAMSRIKALTNLWFVFDYWFLRLFKERKISFSSI